MYGRILRRALAGHQAIGLVHALYQPGYSAWRICPRIRQRKGSHLLRLRKRYWDCWVHGLLVRPLSSAGMVDQLRDLKTKGGGAYALSLGTEMLMGNQLTV